MILIIVTVLIATNFQEKWIIPDGHGAYGRAIIAEIDRNGLTDLVIKRSTSTFDPKILFYEHQNLNNWDLVDSIPLDSLSPYYGPSAQWALGDFDVDGLIDLVCSAAWGPPIVGFSIYEAIDSFSYPTQEVWRDTVGPPLVLPICVYDIDQDGFPEIVKNRATPYGYLGIYESVGDNQYDLIFADDPDTSGLEAPAATIAFGDFDGDGSVEFVPAGGNEWYWIYECTGDNSYDKIAEGQLPTGNIRDCFTVPDADGDGKWEFVIKGFVIPSAEIHVFIFEATADNTYEIIDTLVLPGGDYYGGYSAAGDVDGDSVPEIVLEARQNVFIIKAGANDSFYVWDTLPGHVSGSSVAIYDVDGNGYAEVIVSGDDETRIYEYDPGGVAENGMRITPDALCLEVYPNPFSKQTTISFGRWHPDGTAHSFYGTGNAENIEVKIYDVTGRLVKQFPRLRLDASRPTLIAWNGDDEHGEQVAAGIYYLVAKDEESRSISAVKILKSK